MRSRQARGGPWRSPGKSPGFGWVNRSGSILYPLVNIQKALENGTFIVDLPIEDGDFPYLLENHSYLGKL